MEATDQVWKELRSMRCEVEGWNSRWNFKEEIQEQKIKRATRIANI